MPEEYSTLRAAVDRIMGVPGTSRGGTQGGDVQLAPRAPFSSMADVSSISNVIPATASAATPVIQQSVVPTAPTTIAPASAPTQTQAATVSTAPIATSTIGTAIPIGGAAPAPTLSKPVYPGGGAQGVDWRVSAQYWKDLAAYNQQMGLPPNQR